jgi:hypothetical protein
MKDENPSQGGAFTSPQQPRGRRTADCTRRRRESWRMTRLHCGCRDPLGCRCTRPTLPSYQAAAEHLWALGLTPAADVSALRVMYRAGNESRRVAAAIAKQWGL